MPLETFSEAESQIQTVARGMQVLRAFKSERTPLSNAELVQRTGLSKATVSRLTSTLLQLGYISQAAGSRSFELTAAPLGMGHAFLQHSRLLHIARPFLRDLADQLGVSTALAVQDGLDMLYIDYQAADQVATLRLGPGSILPMSTSAIGRAYLWSLSLDVRQSIMDRFMSHSSPEQARLLQNEIRESFTELEQTGTCCVINGHLRDTFGIALPVRLGHQGILMGMSCGNPGVPPNLSAERKRIIPKLKQAAIQLQSLLAQEDGRP